MDRFRMAWPKDNLYLDCYVHQVHNFRYHWHQDDLELNILLQGKQHFYQETDVYDLEEDDVILVNPNIGHASYHDPEGTLALVLHLSSLALKPFVKKGEALRIENCLSDASTRNDLSYKRIRMYTAQIISCLNRNDQYSLYMAKASTEMLVGTLCTMFHTQTGTSRQEVDEETQKVMRTVLNYLEQNYMKKITLEDIAALTGYNRTYISTLFHQTLGIRFYDYLMRLRLQKAIQDLIATDKSLTEIAMDNGFSDLKSFNSRFKDMLKILPSEYRNMVDKNNIFLDYYALEYIPLDDPLIDRKLKEYMML